MRARDFEFGHPLDTLNPDLCHGGTRCVCRGKFLRTADRLAIGETRLGEADKAMRQAEGELATARESRVRREGLVEQATKDREAVVERIVERLRCEPDGVLALAEVQTLEELPELSTWGTSRQ